MDTHSPKVYEEAIRACNILEYYGFNHESIAGRNLIVGREPKADASRIVIIDLYRHRSLNEGDGYGKYSQYWCPEAMLQAHARYYDEKVPERVFTGRMSDATVFGRGRFSALRHCFDDSDSEANRACTSAKIRYRVIMDDIWQIDHRPILDRDLEQKVLLSQVVHKIIQEERGASNLTRGDWQTWYVRALPRIVDRLCYQTDGLLERFERAFQDYIKRPNTPKLPQGAFVTSNAPHATPSTGKSDDMDASSTSMNSSTTSLSSSAPTSTSLCTSLESLGVKSEFPAQGSLDRIFIPDHARLADFSALEVELRAWLEQKSQETNTA